MKINFYLLTLLCVFGLGCTHIPSTQEQYASIQAATGLHEIKLDGVDRSYLGKTHRGYEVLFRIEAGDVWGRYAARLVAGEIGREVGGITQFITSSYSVGSVVGGPFDRLLSELIGQPISILAVLTHKKPQMPRLDIYNMFSTIKPYDPQPEIEYIGVTAGTMYSADAAFARILLADKALVDRVGNFRSQYIRADDKAVTFMFAGSENEYSGMIRNFQSYEALINGIMDSLADIADAQSK